MHGYLDIDSSQLVLIRYMTFVSKAGYGSLFHTGLNHMLATTVNPDWSVGGYLQVQ